MKYYLWYQYHDDFVYEFDTKEECWNYLKQLIKDYRNDSDFKYKVIEGSVIYE